MLHLEAYASFMPKDAPSPRGMTMRIRSHFVTTKLSTPARRHLLTRSFQGARLFSMNDAARAARENEMEAETAALAIVAAVFGPLFVIAILEALGL